MRQLKLVRFLSRNITGSEHPILKRTTTLIALGSISIGIATIVLSIFVLRGFIDNIQNKSFSFSGHVVVKKFTANDAFLSPVSYQSSFYRRYKEIKGLNYVQGVAYKEGLIENKKNPIGTKRIGGLVLKGFDQTWNTTLFSQNIIEGRLPSVSTASELNEIVISEKLANSLSFKLGDTALMTFFGNTPKYRKVTICGIYEPGMDEFDDIALCNIKLIQSLNKWGSQQVSQFEVFMKDFNDIDTIYEELQNKSDILTRDLYATRITQQYESTFEWLKLLNQQVFLFIILIFFIASFNMASIFFVIIMDNSRKIGLLKIFGASNQMIRFVFLVGGFKTICIGLVLGNTLALGLAFMQHQYHVLPLDYNNYFMHYIPISWEWSALFLVNLVILIVILVSLLIPIHVISSIKPVSAIKFD